MFYFKLFQIIFSDNLNSGVNYPWNFFAFEFFHSGFYRVISHHEWFLGGESVDFTLAQAFDQGLGCIETDEFYFSGFFKISKARSIP